MQGATAHAARGQLRCSPPPRPALLPRSSGCCARSSSRTRSASGGAINQFTVASQHAERRALAGRRRGARRGVHPVFNELLERGEERRAWRSPRPSRRCRLPRPRVDHRDLDASSPSRSRGIFLLPRGASHLTVQLTCAPVADRRAARVRPGIVQAILNSLGEFFVPAIAPVPWNVVIIAFGCSYAMRSSTTRTTPLLGLRLGRRWSARVVQVAAAAAVAARAAAATCASHFDLARPCGAPRVRH